MTEGSRDLVIAGVGGNCIDLLDLVEDLAARDRAPSYRVIGFLDDDPAKIGTTVQGLPVFGGLESASAHPGALFFFGIGSPRNHARREEIWRRMGIGRDRFATLVHPAASVSRRAAVGAGTVIFPHVTVSAGARIGDHVLILPGAVISHDAVVDDFACIAAGASLSGGTRVGRGSYLGTNCALRGFVSIGAGCMVGMGSVVLGDVADGTVVAGNPARPLGKGPHPAGGETGKRPQ